MVIPAAVAAWFLPFVAPICFYVAFTDMREMRIKNHAVTALLIVFVTVGLFLLPPWSGEWVQGSFGLTLPVYVWQLSHFLVVLLAGIVLNAAGAMGAGDAKFCAAAAPFIWTGDLFLVIMILAATTLGSVTAHRLVKHTPLRQFAPDWKSWEMGKKFPMGLTLAGTLCIYLIFGALRGS
ncbi:MULTISPECIES: prepilin peptidase [unclassified Ruegeria]|uniref:prepilin peptidase n=1 Tax=unclassified Ruegeria TaxID=2625375 RepID=UPI001488925B|nr:MULTISPECIES: prepilin peptidase [unclassified Ruegeria]